MVLKCLPIALPRAKPEAGQLTLSAEHQGGNICIEVTDDGAGLNRERILKKAISSGLAVSENMSNEEVAMLIFAPGFSTARLSPMFLDVVWVWML